MLKLWSFSKKDLMVIDATAGIIVADWREKGQASGAKNFDIWSCGRLLTAHQKWKLQ